MFRGRGWRVGQGQRLPRETKQEARLIPRALCTLSAGRPRWESSPEPLEVGEVLLLHEAAIPTTDGPPARAGSSLPKRELSLILYSLYQQVLLALSLEYKQNLTTS